MRFVFDEAGYVACILYGCTSGSCVEYTGLVPDQPEEYADMDDWADRAKVQAYKLDASGNLIYDAERAAALPDENERTPYPPEYWRTMGAVDAIINVIYPVGSIYISVNAANPETLFGGKWEQIKDKFLLSAGDTYSDGETGGSATQEYNLTHKHVAPIGYNSDSQGGFDVNGTVNPGTVKTYRTSYTDHTGSSASGVTAYYTGNAELKGTIDTMPPYLAVFVWKRTA